MGMDPISLGLILGGASLASTGASTYMNMQQASAQRKQATLIEAKKTRESVAQARIAAGASVNNAANQNATGSSSAQSGLGSIQSQMASNLGFMSEYSAQGKEASNAGMWGDVFSGASKIFMTGYKYSDDLFGPKGK